MKLFHFLSVAGFLFSSACSNGQDAKIDAQEYSKLLETQPGYLIDVRTADEFSKGHLKNARNIDYYAKDFREQMLQLDKTKPVYVYCLSGGRSGKAAELMQKNGYKVYNLKGGYTAWQVLKMPVEGNVQTSTGMSLAEYNKLITEETSALVDFYANWCEPCRKMEPVLNKLTHEYKGKMKILRINVEENKQLAAELKVVELPVIVIYKKGTQLKRVNSYQNEDELKALIKLAQ